MRGRTPLLIVALGLLAAGVAVGIYRVAALEQMELEHESEPATLGESGAGDGSPGSALLAEAHLRAGEHAVVELCSEDGLPADRWRGAVQIAVWKPEAELLLSRSALDEDLLALSRRGGGRACVTVARGAVPEDGRYAVEALWDGAVPAAILDVPLRARVLARAPLGPLDRVAVVLSLFGAFALVLALAFGARPPREVDVTGGRMDAGLRLVSAVALVVGAAAAIAAVPWEGAAVSLAAGLGFAVVEVAVAFALVSASPRGEALGVVRPTLGWGRVVLGTAVVALVLAGAARVAVALVPSTGEAPIQTFVAWPSGLLSFALLAVLVPLAEEVFFRGFVYGVALRLGRVAAFALAAGLFVAAHAPQVWGGWGGLVAVTITGLGLTALRAASGSILPGAAAHLAYNTLLAATAVF